MNPLQEIDKVLFAFSANEGIPVPEIEIRLKKKGIEIDSFRLTEILYKLEKKDAYLRVRNEKYTGLAMDISFYVLTFEGELFQLNGGYKGEFDRRVSDEVFQKTMSKLMTVATWVAALATSFLLALESYKCLCP